MTHMRLLSTLLVSALSSACAPIPRTQYVPVVPDNQLVYSECAFNSHVPVGARLPVGRAVAFAKLGTHSGRTFFQVMLDVPPGTTLSLGSDLVEVDAVNSAQRSTARFPSISLIDTPIINSYSSNPAVANQQLPVSTPMVGGELVAGTSRSYRHFWLASYIEGVENQELHVLMPPLLEDGTTVHRLRIAFRPRTVVAVAVINC